MLRCDLIAFSDHSLSQQRKKTRGRGKRNMTLNLYRQPVETFVYIQQTPFILGALFCTFSSLSFHGLHQQDQKTETGPLKPWYPTMSHPCSPASPQQKQWRPLERDYNRMVHCTLEATSPQTRFALFWNFASPPPTVLQVLQQGILQTEK